MNKFKKILLGALSVLTLGLFVVTGAKVNASTTDYKYSFNGISAAGTITDNGLTVTHTTYKGQTASGTSLITGQATNYTSGVKFNSSGKITFNTSNTWTAQILAGGVTSSCGIKVKVDGTQKQTETFTPDSTSKLATINITSKDAGSVEISRTTTEYTVYELIITMEDAAADSHTVTFYDSDKTTELGTRNVADGGTVTSIAVTAPMGQVFDNWLKVSDDKAFDFSTTINDDLSLYASYKTDPNYVVGDGYTLNSALMGALYNEGYTSSFGAESTTLTNTNISILYGTLIKEVDGTPKTYNLNTGGSGSNTKRGISITTTEAGTITFIADGNGSDRTVDISKIVGTSNTVQQSYTLNKNDSSTEYTFTVEAAGTYYLYGSGTINIYYAEFIPAIASNVSLEFDAQYDTEDTADATKLRFIGTIEGVSYDDIANIKSVKFTFTFNGTPRTCTCTALYQSIMNGSTTVKAAANGKLYVVFQLNNINREAYKGESLTNCKLTVVFDDDSSTYVEHANITLPQFTTVIQENA